MDCDDKNLAVCKAENVVLKIEITGLRSALRVLTAAVTKYDIPANARDRKIYSLLCEAQFRALQLAGVEEVKLAAGARIPSKKDGPVISLVMFLEDKSSKRKAESGGGTTT